MLANWLLPRQIKRDVLMLLRGLSRERHLPFTARIPSSRQPSLPDVEEKREIRFGVFEDDYEAPPPSGVAPLPSPRLQSHGRRLVISDVRRETRNAVTLVLRDPEGAPIAFEAGQFFTIAREVNGETLKRAYSASSSALEPGSVSITIKRVEGGRVSNAVNDDIAVGHVFDVLGPSGSFTVPAHALDLVLVGGGSGITPLMSIAKTTLGSRENARVTLLFGNRSPEDVIFAGEIAELERIHGDRFVVRHVLEREGDRPLSCRLGRLDEDTLSEELAEAARREGAQFFICGPEVVMTGAERVLSAMGVPKDRIKIERFSSLRVATATDVPEEVSVFIGGQRASLTVAPRETLLEAAMRADVPLPFSCTVGGCGACRVRLIAGDVALDEPNCLHPDERRAGYILSCVSRPLGPITVEVEP